MIISSMALVLVGFYVGLVWFEAARNMGLLVMSTFVCLEPPAYARKKTFFQILEDNLVDRFREAD